MSKYQLLSEKQKEKRRACARRWHYANPEKIKKNRAIEQAKYRDFFNRLKNKPCMDCQGWFEPCQMEFDHRPNEIKSFALGSRCYSNRIKLMTEMDKCDLVCSNCHRLRTWKRQVGKN